jgi:phosphomannomutase
MPLKAELNVSGYRGVWGESLNEEIVKNYAIAFALFTKEATKKESPTILIGRDGRASGPIIKEIILKELRSIGIDVIDGDLLPTPTVLFSVRKHGYDGAIIITASHNPIEYNGLKFVNSKALYTINEEVEKIKEFYEKIIQENIVPIDAVEKNTEHKGVKPDFIKEHIDHIVSNVNVNAIKSKGYKIVVDMINASACAMYPYLSEKLGFELIPLNNEPNGMFAHRPEPLKENLSSTEEKVKSSGADLGFVHDPDADRLVIINEKGEVISEEYSLAFGVENILSRNRGRNIVINLSTSQMSVEIAKKYGSQTFRTKIGEGYVVDGIVKHDAIIGGEGNGGVIYPTINTVRDSFTTLALVLELLAERGLSVSECTETLPKYFIKKDKWPIENNLPELYEKLESHFKLAKVDRQDGVRLDFEDDSWIHLRPSNTEPIIRIFGEAKTESRINALFEETRLTLGLQ